MALKKQNLFYFLLIGTLVFFALIFSYKNGINQLNIDQFDIQKLSSEQVIIPYLRQNHKLPEYYITKKEARKLGWKPEKRNLCDILPGRVIGGDIFTNRQKTVPHNKGRKWYEADINYACGNRGINRLIFSNDGLIYITYDHYKTFKQR